MRLRGLPPEERLQYFVFIGISLTIVGLTGAAYSLDRLTFEQFIGDMNPLGPMILIVILGIALMLYLDSRGWFSIWTKEDVKGVPFWLALAAVFALITVLIDIKFVLPEDINVPLPESLLYYPSMGFAAEVLFHLLPITLILFALTSHFGDKGLKKNTWVCILAVAIVEPLFQIVVGVSEPQPLWTSVFLGLNLYFFSLSQLIVFKRYGFVWMYGMRLVYYVLWHIVWGYYRLDILF